MLNVKLDECPYLDRISRVLDYIKNHAQSLALEHELELCLSDNACLKILGEKEENFKLDILDKKLMWRLNHSGKNSEAVARAVIGKLTKPVVFDATAGLGRESLILQQAGAEVYMFERNPVVYLMLFASLYEHQSDPLVKELRHGLPTLFEYGSIKEHFDKKSLNISPDVIYYDPMFPERDKSAKVKKNMQVFHKVVGFDEDTLEYANFLCDLAKHHLVVKRPSNEKPLELKLRRSSFVDGKACRFDCYYTGQED